MKALSQERLKYLMSYDKDTGIFTRLVDVNGRAKAGDVAGTHNESGYIIIQIDRCKYRAHRLAFLYVDGYIPEYEVDHINRIRDDNRWENLRHVSRACNCKNMAQFYTNTSDVTGVSLVESDMTWRAYINKKDKQIYLGKFKVFYHAVIVRWHAEIKYEWGICCSDSSAYNYLKDNGHIISEWERN